MSYNISDLGTDPVKVSEGVILMLGGSGSGIRLAPTFGSRYASVWDKVTKPYRRQIKAGTLADDVLRDLETKALAKGCILNWQDLQFTGDDDLEHELGPYSPNRAYEALKRIPGFREAIKEHASDWGHFR